MEVVQTDTVLFTRVVEHAPDGMLLVDARNPDAPLIHVNQALENLTGYRREQLLGQPLRTLLPGDEVARFEPDLAACLVADTTSILTLPSQRADGSRFWSELTTVPLRDGGGQAAHLLGVLRNIDARIALQQQVQSLEHELDFSSRELVKLATRDTLTTLYNRRYFLKRLEREWQRCLHDRCPLVLFDLAVDGFKRFNELRGTQAGDECLQRVAHVLSTSFPMATDVVARYGSGEFIVSSDGMDATVALARAREVADRVREQPLRDADGQSLSVSIGLVWGMPAPGLTPDRFMVAAARALTAARRQGGGRICRDSVA